MRESRFQADLIVDLKALFPGAIVIKAPSDYIQGIPDLLILWGPRWAALEVKKSASEPYQPNQEYYVAKMNEMSFASSIYPENKERVLNELQHAFGLSG